MKPLLDIVVSDLKRRLQSFHLRRIVLDDVECLSIVVVQEFTYERRAMLALLACRQNQLTELEVLLFIPLFEVQVQSLRPMELRSVSNGTRDIVGCREYALHCLKIFNTTSGLVKYVEVRLA